MDATLVSCDWGTSTLRLRLVEVETRHVLAAVETPQGIKQTYQRWKETSQDRAAYFEGVLGDALRQLEAAAGRLLAGTPLVASGMASSSIGLVEVPYGTLPFALAVSQPPFRLLGPHPGRPYPLLLLSGLRTERDVMRGEETELIGLWEALEVPAAAVFVLPGTHSKHVLVEDAAIRDFRTAMTGELFDVLQTGSVLREAVVPAPFTETFRAAFVRGVEESSRAPLPQALFAVRTEVLFKRLTGQQAYWHLSGLLIGSELTALEALPRHPVYLCAGDRHGPRYKTALDVFGWLPRTTVVPAALVQQSAVRGHLVAYRRVLLNDFPSPL